MNTYALKCPNCGGHLTVEDGLDIFFCKYCGYRIVLEGQSDAAYRAKTRIHGMAHDERMADKKYEHEKYRIKQKANQDRSDALIPFLAILVVFGAFFVLINFFATTEENKSIKQEQELHALVDEIMIDINNEDFESAYIKAQSISYTENWSDEIEEKWERTRKEVINQIIEAEKEATGSSSHKPEKDGWFWGWFD